MARGRIHDLSPRQGLDRLALFIAFALGVGGTVYLKFQAVPVLVVALFPVAILLGYVAACFFTRALEIEPETIGDNCYYLGFLFTLTSLAVTLYEIRDLGEARDDALIPLVISGFGVALSSTIAGVFLRVALMQMRPDIVARDREARRDLSKGARDLRDAVADASRTLKQIAVETGQHVAERNDQMFALSEAHATRSSESLDRQAAAHEAAIAERNERLVQLTEEHIAQSAALLEKQSASHEAMIADLGRRLAEDIVGAFQTQATTSATRIEEAANALADSLGRIERAQTDGEAGLKAGIEALKDGANGFRDAMSEHHKVAQNSYRTLAARSKQAEESLDEMLRLARMTLDNLEASDAERRKSFAAREEAFSQRTEAVLDALGRVSEALSAKASAIGGSERDEAFALRAQGIDNALIEVEGALRRRAAKIEAEPVPVAEKPVLPEAGEKADPVTASAPAQSRGIFGNWRTGTG